MENTLLNKYSDNRRNICFFLGLVLIIILYIPFILLQGKGYFIIHDQLDDSVIKQILTSKHLGDGSTYFPEMLSGTVEKNKDFSLNPFIYSYYIFKPVMAFILNTVTISIIAYIGMYLLVEKIGKQPEMAMISAMTFAILPFYTTYGLSAMGGPIVIYAFINLYNREKIKSSLFFVILYTCSSSLILSGYFLVGMLFLISLYIIFAKKTQGKKYFFIAFGVLFALYMVGYFPTIKNLIFGGNDSLPSHRSEMCPSGSNLTHGFWDILMNGQYHAVSLHYFILIIACIFGILGLFRVFKGPAEIKKKYIIFYISFAMILVIALFAGFWKWYPIVDMRNSIGGFIKFFQADRLYFWNPTLWYLIFGLMLSIIADELIIWKSKCKKANIIKSTLGIVASGILVLFISFNVWQSSIVNYNLDEYLQPGYRPMISWNEFYAEDVMKDIKNYIGKDQSSYRVASIGIHPATALYNGFYCIDGYSPNYPLEYKHEFRKIIAGELDKSSNLEVYFDNWGNRCYVFSNDIGRNYYIGKNSTDISIKDLDINTEIMLGLGCEYIFSSVPIDNYQELDLTYERSFETKDSFYKVYLYSLQ